MAVVGPAELLGLACDDRVASRLIERWGAEGGGAEWSVRQGPFDEEDFEDGEDDQRRWTVLVQEVDRHVPEVADLLNAFCFVPSWRVDDVCVAGLGVSESHLIFISSHLISVTHTHYDRMISYAPEAGGIGPHVDNYDVFLLQVRDLVTQAGPAPSSQSVSTSQLINHHPRTQGRGTRRWRIQGAVLGAAEEREGLIPNSPVRILGSFEEDHAWVLQPGDMLYLPPRWVGE